MKKWLAILSALSLTACATAPGSAPQAAPQKPAPKEVTIELPVITKVVSSYPDGQAAGTVLSTYDAEGFLIKEESLNPNGTLLESKIGKRSGKTNKIEALSPSGETQSTKEVLLSDDNRVLKEIFYNTKDQIQTINEYSYDKNGKMTLWITKGPSENVLAKTEYLYESGYNTKINLWDDKGMISKTFDNFFNKQGLMVQKKETEADGTLTSVTVYTYNSEGKLIKDDLQNGKGSSLRAIEYQLNERGLPSKTTYFDRRGKVVEIKLQEYNIIKKTFLVSE